MCRLPKVNGLPEIIKYGSVQVILESSIKPQIKVSLPSAIKLLKQVAFSHKIVSLSANQIGLDQRVFVAMKPHLIKAGKWTGYEEVLQANQVNTAIGAYDAIINPVQKSSCYDTYLGFEQCPSFPGLKFKIPIPIYSNITYLTELALMEFFQKNKGGNSYTVPENLYSEKKLTGFLGRVWDHQIRHLEGILPITQKMCGGEFFLIDDFKHDVENVDYYENLKKIQQTYLQKNLKKLQKQTKAKVKKQKSSPGNSSQIPESISQSALKYKSFINKK